MIYLKHNTAALYTYTSEVHVQLLWYKPTNTNPNTLPKLTEPAEVLKPYRNVNEIHSKGSRHIQTSVYSGPFIVEGSLLKHGNQRTSRSIKT